MPTPTFLSAGGSETFDLTPWTVAGSAEISSSNTNGQARSIRWPGGAAATSMYKDGVLADAGRRICLNLYVAALPTGATRNVCMVRTAAGINVFLFQVTTAGELRVVATATQVALVSGVFAAGARVRLCISYTITSTTVNELRVYANGVLIVNLSNITFTTIVSARLAFFQAADTFEAFLTDLYVDDSAALTDVGNVRVTAKRPFAAGTTNDFDTQIGSGGSSYGSGHAPQVNERPLSITNGWSEVGAGAAAQEFYTLEQPGDGDYAIGPNSPFASMGWVYASSLSPETASIIIDGIPSNISLISTPTHFMRAGSLSDPFSVAAIGLQSSTDVTTVSLYECGVLFAFLEPGLINNPIIKSQAVMRAANR